jgi:hypothetical protein
MKKLFIAILFLFAVNLSYSDQLAWLTKAQAEKTVDYFVEEGIDQVVLWCACCDNDVKTKVNVTEVYYRQVKESSEYYEIVIKGKYMGGNKLEQAFDLAYVHVARGGKWRCLGKELKFECDPCTKAFKF